MTLRTLSAQTDFSVPVGAFSGLVHPFVSAENPSKKNVEKTSDGDGNKTIVVSASNHSRRLLFVQTYSAVCKIKRICCWHHCHLSDTNYASNKARAPENRERCIVQGMCGLAVPYITEITQYHVSSNNN